MQEFCPNCNANLNEQGNAILTKESAIFKGHNVYCMCTQCGYTMVYNLDRKLIFSLDRFKDDEDIIEEIQRLLSEATNQTVELSHEAPPKEDVHECDGMCHRCNGCYDEQVKQEVKEEQQPRNQVMECLSAGDLLIINKETKLASFIAQENLDKINIDDFDFFEITPVSVQRVVTYKVERL